MEMWNGFVAGLQMPAHVPSPTPAFDFRNVRLRCQWRGRHRSVLREFAPGISLRARREFLLSIDSGFRLITFPDRRKEQKQQCGDEYENAGNQEPAFRAIIFGQEAFNAEADGSGQIADTAGKREDSAQINSLVVGLQDRCVGAPVERTGETDQERTDCKEPESTGRKGT